MALYECGVCGYIYDEDKQGKNWDGLPEDWICPVCDSARSYFNLTGDNRIREESHPSGLAKELIRTSDELETYMVDIHRISETGESIIEPMRTKKKTFTWDDILIKGAQLAKIPLNENEPVSTKTVIGRGAGQPLVISMKVATLDSALDSHS